jgi:hypothetical protein
VKKVTPQQRKETVPIPLFETDKVINDIFESRQFLDRLLAKIDHRLFYLKIAVPTAFIHNPSTMSVRMDKHQALVGLSFNNGLQSIFDPSLVVDKKSIA